jgi:putative flippase GtrA
LVTLTHNRRYQNEYKQDRHGYSPCRIFRVDHFHYILHKEVLDLGFMVLKPYNAALIMAFFITFPTGFLMSKYIVWTESNLSGKVQLFRYFLLVMTNFFLNYVMMMFFVEFLHFFPTLAKFLTIIIVVFYSYTSQKYFTFREKKA